jgi:hypothetical protein
MISSVKNTPVSGRDITIFLYREETGWTNVASFSSGTIEASVEDQKYYYLGSNTPVLYSQATMVNITLERAHVNAELLTEFKETMSDTNCGYNRPIYLVQVKVCFPGDDEHSGEYLYKMKECKFKSDTINLQAGNAENTETLVIEGTNVDIEKI